MPLTPAILALNLASLTQSLLLLLAAGFAIQILRHWDLSSGSERQLGLERRTYLIATLVACVGVAVPLVGGTLLYSVFYGFSAVGSPEFYRALFIGTIMTATLPVDGDYNVSVYGNAKYQVAFEIK